MTEIKQYVYFFGEGTKDMKKLLREGKGANLSEMTNIGLSVPPRFTITAETCILFYELGKKYPDLYPNPLFYLTIMLNSGWIPVLYLFLLKANIYKSKHNKALKHKLYLLIN